MRFFITGGAGFLGINMARYLLERGHEVVSYDIAPFEYPERDRVTPVVGDIRDFAALSAAMQGSDVVIHTAAALPLYPVADIRSTDIDGTRNVLESAVMNKVPRVIHISSTAVYGVPDHHPLTEDDPVDGVGEYGKAKIAAEALCKEYREKGLCVTIIRPKSFVGPERLGVFALFYDWAADGHGFPMLGDGSNRYQLMDVDNISKNIRITSLKLIDQSGRIFTVEQFYTCENPYQKFSDNSLLSYRAFTIKPGIPCRVSALFETSDSSKQFNLEVNWR
jgi:nucleoside-diphosphate-sugar epimerase